MNSINLFKQGFANKSVLVLLLILGAVGATMMVASSQTDFLNQAYSGEHSWVGVVQKAEPCVATNLCYKLTQTSNGVDHYLLARKSFNFEKPTKCIMPDQGVCPGNKLDLASYVGKRVQVFGTVIKGKEVEYIYVIGVGIVGVGQGRDVCSHDTSGKVICPELTDPIDCQVGMKPYFPGTLDNCGCRQTPYCVPTGNIKPPIGGLRTCQTDQDCSNTQCKPPLKCAQTGQSARCISGHCQIEAL